MWVAAEVSLSYPYLLSLAMWLTHELKHGVDVVVVKY